MAVTRRRSTAPIFWLLFGAGGMLAALIGPMLAFITGIGGLPGIVVPEEALGYSRMLGFAQHWFGKLFLFALVSLILWHAAHRIYHTLHDLGVHTGLGVKVVCYGLTLLATLAAAWALLAIGF